MNDLKMPRAQNPRLWLVGGGFLALLGFLTLLFESQFEAATGHNGVALGANLLLLGIFLGMAALKTLYAATAMLIFRIAAALSIAGAGLLVLEGTLERSLNVDSGVVGALTLIVGIGVALYGLRTTRARSDSLVTLGERIAIVSLAANVLIAGYLIYGFQQYGLELGTDSGGTWKLLLIVVAVVIVEAIAVGVLARREPSAAVEDERDDGIRTRAASNSHTALLALLVPPIALVGLLPNSWVARVSATALAHQLILLVIVAEIVRHASAVWLYRKDRT